MKLRLTKKKNKKRVYKILEQLPYTVTETRFGNGYFMYTFGEAAVCWFWLKELPALKCGIWLNKKGFDIFAEHKECIDKFKPSYTQIACDSTAEFCKELEEYQFSNDEHWIEYRDTIKHNIEYRRQTDEWNHKVRTLVNEVLFKEFKNDIFGFKIHDKNTRNFSVSPRYEIKVNGSNDFVKWIHQDETRFEYFEYYLASILEILRNRFKVLTREITTYYGTFSSFEYRIDDYVCHDFSFNYNMSWFDKNWELESFKKNDEKKIFEISNDTLYRTLDGWKESNYPDSPTPMGYHATLERLYKGRYSKAAAALKIQELFKTQLDYSPNIGDVYKEEITNIKNQIQQFKGN